MDIVDFVEECFGIKLLEFQKEFLRHIEKHPRSIVVPRGGRTPCYITWYILYKCFFNEYKNSYCE